MQQNLCKRHKVESLSDLYGARSLWNYESATGQKVFLALFQENYTRKIHLRGSVRGYPSRKIAPIEMKPVQVASAEELIAMHPKQLDQCYICKVWCSNPKVGWLDRYHTRPVCPECWDKLEIFDESKTE